MSAPRPGQNLHVWANQIVDYLTSTADVLTKRRSNATAARDGVMLWDTAGYPVVSRNGEFLRVSMQVAAPATATSAGQAGQWAYDASYFYICTGTDTWGRAAILTW